MNRIRALSDGILLSPLEFCLILSSSLDIDGIIKSQLPTSVRGLVEVVGEGFKILPLPTSPLHDFANSLINAILLPTSEFFSNPSSLDSDALRDRLFLIYGRYCRFIGLLGAISDISDVRYLYRLSAVS